MKYIITCEEVERIRKFIIGDQSWSNEMTRKNKYNFAIKARNFVLRNQIVFISVNDSVKEIVADDDNDRLKQVLDYLHLPDHTGMKAMYENSKNLYAGFKREKIDEYVRMCQVCSRHRPLARVSPITPIISEFPWDLVQMDCVDMRNYADVNDGFGWILNITDCYSKYLYSVAMKNKTAESILNSFKKVLFAEGAPKSVQTDNGKEFVNRYLKEFLECHNIKHIRGRPRHPQNQGQVERLNQTIVRKIAKALSENPVKRWIDLHDIIVHKYNTTWSRATNMNPMQAFRGRLGINPRSDTLLIIDTAEDHIEDSVESPIILSTLLGLKMMMIFQLIKRWL